MAVTALADIVRHITGAAMKICYIVPWFTSINPTTPEASQGIFEYRQVVKMSEAGHSFKVVTVQWRGQTAYEKVNDNLDVYRIPPIFIVKSVRYPFPALVRLTKAIKDVCDTWDPDILVFSHMEYLTALPGLLLKLLVKKPIVMVADTFPGISWFFGDKKVDTIGYVYSRLVSKRLLQLADGVQLRCSDLYPYMDVMGIDRGKTFAVGRGVDTGVFKPRRADRSMLRPLGISEDDTVVLYVGRLDLVKGVDYLIRAAHNILPGREHVKFLIVGDGILRPEYEEMAKPWSDHIIFAGYRSDVPDIMSISDIFVQPSLSEVAANAVMEASASGLAVVATGVGEIPSIVDDGRTGVLVKAKDVDGLTKALDFLLGDISLARDMGLAGRSRVEERYTWGVINKRIEECYSNVIRNY